MPTQFSSPGMTGRVGPALPAPVERLIKGAAKLPMGAVWAGAVVGVVLVGLADLVTGSELSLSFFYLLPLALVAWRSQLAMATLASVIAATVWLAADLVRSDGYSHSAIPYWNAGIRFGFFAVVSTLLVRVRRSLDVERAQATVDPLTGIANGRAFRSSLEFEVARARRYGRPISVGYVDLDDFKPINDGFGHHAGDDVLRGVAAALGATLRATDMVARLGGDEFAVLLPESGLDAAESAFGKILTNLSSVTDPGGSPVRVSAGVLVCEQAPASAEAVLREADRLMYRAKAGGKGQVAYELFTGAEPPVPESSPA